MNTLASFPDVHERVAIHDEAQLVVAADSEVQCLVGLCHKGSIESCRTVLQVYARCKDRVPTIAQVDGLTGILHRNRGTLHLGIVPIGNLHTAIAERVFEQAKAALIDLVACEGTARDIACLRHIVPNSVEGGDGMCGIACIVAPHHHRVVGIRTHHHHIGCLGG